MGQRKTKLRPQSPPPPCSSPTSAYSVLSLPTLDYSGVSAAGNANGPKQTTTALKRTSSTVSVTPSRPPVGKNRKTKRRGSLKRQPQTEDRFVALRRKIEQEAKALDEWVSQSSPSQRIPALVDIAALSVASRLPQASAVSRLPISQELKDAVEFRISPCFDDSLACDKVYISNEGRSISYVGRGYSTTVMKTPFGRGFRSGRHAWLIHVDNSRVIGWMQVGVVNEERHASGCKTLWDGNPHPFREGEMARISNGNFHTGIKQSSSSMLRPSLLVGGFTTGDTLAVQLDLDMGTIQWLRNGEEYGPVEAVNGEEFFPSVSLDSPGESVTLAYYCGPVTL